MIEQLKKLNEAVGIRGSLIMTPDGMVVASNLGRGLDEETIAALASSVLKALENPASSFRMGSFSLGDVARFTLSSAHGRLIFEIVDNLVLVAVTDKDMDLELTLLEIAGVTKRLQRMTQLTV